MATGANGFGLQHGYTDVDEVDRDISHESKGHGVQRSVSEKRIQKRVDGAQVGQKRLKQFSDKK